MKQFCDVIRGLDLNRPSSGMPKQIISGKNRSDSTHFVITGSKETKVYTVDLVIPGQSPLRLRDDLKGIQEARRWIAQYVRENLSKLSFPKEGNEWIITDRCEMPGRDKPSWNQWKLSSY